MRLPRPQLLPFTLVLLGACQDHEPTGPALRVPAAPLFALTAGPVTPIDGGLVNTPVVTIASSPSFAHPPQVSGDVACIRDAATNDISYYRFSTAVTTPVPAAAAGDCAIDGNVILLPQFAAATTGFATDIRAFDLTTSTLILVADRPDAYFNDVAVGGGTVAFGDVVMDWNTFIRQESHVRVADLTAPGTSQQVSAVGPFHADHIRVSPDGNVVVWRHRAPPGSDTDIMKAVRNGGVWSAAQPVTQTPGTPEQHPDTDGTYIVHSSDAGLMVENVSPGGLQGGPVMRVDVPDETSGTRIDQGVILFHHTRYDANGDGYSDLKVYVIATNTLYQITDTPEFEGFSDIDVLADGRIRVVWTTLQAGTYWTRATTFQPSGGPTFNFGGFIGRFASTAGTLISIKAGSVGPVLFTLGGDHGLDIFAPGSPSSAPVQTCGTNTPIGADVPTAKPGASLTAYDAATGIYTYQWHTSQAWAGTCRRLLLQFTDGSSAIAHVRFF